MPELIQFARDRTAIWTSSIAPDAFSDSPTLINLRRIRARTAMSVYSGPRRSRAGIPVALRMPWDHYARQYPGSWGMGR